MIINALTFNYSEIKHKRKQPPNRSPNIDPNWYLLYCYYTVITKRLCNFLFRLSWKLFYEEIVQ